jgi:hypothetical protein
MIEDLCNTWLKEANVLQKEKMLAVNHGDFAGKRFRTAII